MAAVIKDYETKNSNVSIKYSKQSYQDYRVRLQNALNSENGPDIFRYHASWVPMLRQQLSAIPTSVMSPNDYQTTFYPVAVNQLQSNGQLVGIPLMYDGLALYYNTELFETAVVTPPKTWAELRTIASQLTLKSGSTVTRGGLAMGNATNVEHFADVLALLILQNGGDLSKPDSAEVRDALLFYTNFINTDQVWSASLPSSTVAFSRGDAAMMIAPSWRAHEIKAMNPDLKFATTPVPQLSDTRISWATYWAEGVSGKSSKKDESWKFLKYLSSKEVQQKLYADQAKARSFGELYSRKDLANELAGDPLTSAFMQDAPYAKGWQMSSYTHDDGANDQIIKYYEDAITALNEGESIEDVQATLTQGVSQVLRQYGISSATTQ
jgi:multiple sugar transport system substrate-binding protein